MLQVGGRAPEDALKPFFGVDAIETTWRVQRLALFLRLANSPAGSLQQIALITLRSLDDEWFLDVVADMCLVVPGINFEVLQSSEGPYLRSSGLWNDAGEWLSAQPWGFMFSPDGRGLQSGFGSRIVKRHIRRCTEIFKASVRRQSNSAAYANIEQKCTAC